ncbi:MAG: flagellar biosynthesis anti-sigma factor FlgM [Oscillospiraceae bacterium]|nr:flagellar biosynthesis anti-sigma factor FlgM [Oscillospiraceae bacterium]
MNIDFNPCSGYMRTQAINNKNAKPGSVKSPLNGGKNDSVSISPEAAAFNKLDCGVKEIASQINTGASQERIDALKAQIRSGTYNVSARDVADAILQHIGL